METFKPGPILYWSVEYSALGWTTNKGWVGIAFPITEKQARWIIGMIRRATETASINHGLTSIDHKN